jgi:hypothetical protein
MRTIRSLVLPPVEAAKFDPFTMRLAPSWVDDADGTTTPIGIFVATAAPTTSNSYGDTVELTLADQATLLSRSDGRVVVDPAGQAVHVGIEADLQAAGIADYHVDHTATLIGGTGLAWPLGSTPAQRIADRIALGSYQPLYFDNDGVGWVRVAPDLTVAVADFDYDADGEIVRDSLTTEDQRIGAWNQSVVVDGGDNAVDLVGRYDIPADLPWSQESTGIVVSRPPETVQGMSTQAQANAVARSRALADRSLQIRDEFDTPVDPTHDVFAVCRRLDLLWLEVAWSIDSARQTQHHALVRSLVT